MLLLATAFWGLSFPAMKALALVQQQEMPQANSWFIASLSIVYRFAAAALILLPICWRTLRKITVLEVKEGCGLGLCAAGGLLFQMDGLAYTAASTSAFLTQFYCVIIPVLVALRQRRWPPPVIVLCVLLVMNGVAVLSDIDWRTLRMGRGELETLAGSTIFTGQILWLQRAGFRSNNVNHFTIIMFAVIALLCLPVAVAHTGEPADWWRAYAHGPALLLLAGLTVICTFGAYVLMNAWQPFVTATQAGLIYCAEPIFASLYAFFLPGWISRMAGLDYRNEEPGLALLWGGGLITCANVLIQLAPAPQAGTEKLEPS